MRPIEQLDPAELWSSIPMQRSIDVPPHTLALVHDGKVVGVIRDVDGIEPSPQADGDSRPAEAT